MVKFGVSPEDRVLIDRIVTRVMATRDRSNPYPKQDCDMDITACHANGSPLDLQKLLTAPVFTFFHDVYGIRANLDRKTGKLINHFLPRCSA